MKGFFGIFDSLGNYFIYSFVFAVYWHLANCGNVFAVVSVCTMAAVLDRSIFTDSHAKSILSTMNNLRKSNTLCDVTLYVDGCQFPVHRIVLAACSDYFCAMFTHQVLYRISVHVVFNCGSICSLDLDLDFFANFLLDIVACCLSLLLLCSSSLFYFILVSF